MRRAQVKAALAVTAMVVLALAVPLGLVVQEVAGDRVFTAAGRQAAAIQPAPAVPTGHEALQRAVASTDADADGIAVHVPAPAAGDGGGRRLPRAAGPAPHPAP